jgi:hypothetical protein
LVVAEQDMGIGEKGKVSATLTQLTKDYQTNMKALREATLKAGKFAWQMLWTGGAADSIGGTGLGPLVSKNGCATTMRARCAADSPSQKRAMAYGMSGQPHTRSADLLQVRRRLRLRRQNADRERRGRLPYLTYLPVSI